MLQTKILLLLIFSVDKGDALTLLTKSTKFLATMKKDTSEELQVDHEINVNILTGIGNVMKASSKQADFDASDEDPTIDRVKVRGIRINT